MGAGVLVVHAELLEDGEAQRARDVEGGGDGRGRRGVRRRRQRQRVQVARQGLHGAHGRRVQPRQRQQRALPHHVELAEGAAVAAAAGGAAGRAGPRGHAGGAQAHREAVQEALGARQPVAAAGEQREGVVEEGARGGRGRAVEGRGRRRRLRCGAERAAHGRAHVEDLLAGERRVGGVGGAAQGALGRERGVWGGAGGAGVGAAALLGVVDEVAARAVGAEADGVEGAAQLRLVLGVPRERAQLQLAVRELALLAVLAVAVLLEGAAQLRLVARRVGLARVAALDGLRVRAVQPPVQVLWLHGRERGLGGVGLLQQLGVGAGGGDGGPHGRRVALAQGQVAPDGLVVHVAAVPARAQHSVGM